MSINVNIGQTTPATTYRLVVLFEEYPNQTGRVTVRTGLTKADADAAVRETGGYVVACQYGVAGAFHSIPAHRIYARRMEPEG